MKLSNITKGLRSRMATAIGGKEWIDSWKAILAGANYDTGNGSYSSRFHTDNDFLRAMRNVETVYKCCALINRNIRRPKWWFEESGGGKKQKIIEIPDLASLLKTPNPWMSGKDLLEATQCYIDLCGKAYWYLGEMNALSLFKQGKDAQVLTLEGKPQLKVPENPLAGGIPKQIWYLRPDLVTPKQGGPGELFKEFIYEPNPGQKEVIPAGAIIYFRRFDPLNMMDGLGVVEAMRHTLESDREAKDWNRRYFKNSGRPDVVISSDQELTKEQMARYTAEWNSRFQGPANEHLTAILGNGAKPFLLGGNTLKDMDFVKLLEFTEKDICGAFGVPPAKIGISEAGALGNSNFQEQDKSFWAEGMEPRMEMLADKITNDLVHRFNPNAEMAFEDMTPDDMKLKAEIAATLVDKRIWTPNQAREECGWGEPYDGGDVIFVSSSLQPIDLAINPPEPQPIYLRPPQEQPQGEPEGEQGAEQANEGEDAPQGNVARGMTARELLALPLDERNRVLEDAAANALSDYFPKRLPPGVLRDGSKYHKSLPQSDHDLTQRRFRATALKEFQRQEREVMGNTDSVLADYAKDMQSYAKRQEPERRVIDQVVGDLADWEGLAKEFRKSLRLEYVNALSLAGSTALSDLGVDIIFNVEHPAVLSWLANYIPILEDSVTSTTQGALSVAIRTAVENDASLSELKDAVREVFKQAKQVRAETIAITEGNRSLNEGELMAWRQSMVVEGKQWVLGPEPCDFCLDMEGEVQDINTEFYSKGDTITRENEETLEIDYVGVDGPPLHPHCVCLLIPVLLEAQ